MGGLWVGDIATGSDQGDLGGDLMALAPHVQDALASVGLGNLVAGPVTEVVDSCQGFSTHGHVHGGDLNGGCDVARSLGRLGPELEPCLDELDDVDRGGLSGGIDALGVGFVGDEHEQARHEAVRDLAVGDVLEELAG